MPTMRRILRLLGLIAIPAATWKMFERRFAEGEAERQRLTEAVEAARTALAEAGGGAPDDLAAALRALRSDGAGREASLGERLAAAEAAAAAAQAQQNSLLGQLEACRREREVYALSIGRAEARVKALARRRDRIAAERDACRARLAAGDTTGRVLELEAEGRRLALRVADLERYLAETRGEGARAYL